MLCIRAPTLFVLTDWLWTYPFGYIAVTYCLPPSYGRGLLSPCGRVKSNSGLFRWTYCYALLCRLCSFGHIAVLILMRLNPQFVCCIFYSVYFLNIQSFIFSAITILAICLFLVEPLERFELPTVAFEAQCSDPLSYRGLNTIMSNTYCPFVYHQLMVDFQGKVSACCQFEATCEYDRYDDMMKPYREAMQRGEQIEPCRRCWQDEANSFPSLRQSAINDFKRYSEHAGLMILDIRINNHCNLACTMCSDHSSNLWGKLVGSNISTRLDDTLQDRLIKDSEKILKLSIQGGEPFYGNDFIDFVERLPNKANIQLEIFSNTITANVDVLEKWCSEFKQVMFISSVDGIEETFESIRWPARWYKIERKILELYEIKNLGLNFNFTLQNLNILNIGKFLNWRNKTVPKCATTISILEWPVHFQFTVLDEYEKEQALLLLDDIQTPFSSEADVLDNVRQQLLLAPLNHEMLQIRYKQSEIIEQMRLRYLNRSSQ